MSIQILPQVPGFGTQLAQALTQAGSQLGQSFLDRSVMNQLQNPNLSSMQKIALIGSLPKEKAASVATMYAPILKEEAKTAGLQQIFSQPQTTAQPIVSGTENQIQQQVPQQQLDQYSWNKLSPEQRLKLTARNPAMAQALETASYHQLEREEKQKGREFDLVKDYIKEVQNNEAKAPIKQTALNASKNAFETGNLGAFSRDYLADLTGLEAFRSEKGAQALTAGKEFFLGNLSRVKAKGVNMWLEKQLKEMQPQIGRNRAANLITNAMLQNEIDLQQKEGELLNKYLDDVDSGKISYRKVPSLVSKELSKFATDKEKQLISNIKQIQKDYGKQKSGTTKTQITIQKTPTSNKVKYKVGEEFLEIPQEKEQEFLSKVPGAIKQ